MKLSQNFSLKELTQSQTAARKGINNNPNEDQVVKMKALCKNVLQKVRNRFAKVVTVSSGFRCEALCVAIGSSVNSQHAKGEAADFEITGVDNFDLAIWISKNLNFDQLISEFYVEGDEDSGWVHCSVKKEGNRKQCLTAYKEGSKTVYGNGLTIMK